MSTSTTAGMEFIVEASIRVCTEDHVASTIDDTIVGIGSYVVKQLIDCVESFGGGCCLASTDGTEGNEEFVVNSASVVEETSNDGLDATDGLEIEGWTVVDVNSL